jgi:hypothetical protein
LGEENVPKNEPPYHHLDAHTRQLCEALTEFPGIKTIDSCQGFIEDHRPGKPWHVYFQPVPPITPAAYASIEFIVSQRREARASGFDIYIEAGSPPPALNGIGESLYFVIKCANDHPDRFAAFLREMRRKFFILPN